MADSLLEMLCDDARLALDDPELGAKFSDTQIVHTARMAAMRMFRDLQGISTKPVVLIHEFEVNQTTLKYTLPPSIGEVRMMGEWDETLGRYKTVFWQGGRLSPVRNNIFLSGNQIILDRTSNETFTMRIEYIPSGDFEMHGGKITPGTNPGSGGFWLVRGDQEATNLLRGHTDDREGAYIGCTLRFWRTAQVPALVRQGLILSHVVDPDLATMEQRRKVTFSPEITPTLAVEWQYEIIPSWLPAYWALVTMGTALTLASFCGQSQRYSGGLLREYQAQCRAVRLSEFNSAGSHTRKFEGYTYGGIFGRLR